MNPPTKEDLIKEILEKQIIIRNICARATVALEKARAIESEARAMHENLKDQALLQLKDPSQPINHSLLEQSREM